MMRLSCVAAVCCLESGFSPLAMAQSQPTAPRGHDVPQPLDSGFLGNAAGRPQIVFSEVVQHKSAAWVRLHFAEITLAPGSRVRFTSLLEGETQELDSAGCAMWSYTSAYLTGDALRIELIAAPGSVLNRLVLDHLSLEMPGEEPEGGAGQCGICGADDRTPSTEPWSGRLMSVGCTASLYNACGCIISAGHCAGGAGLVLQFNVPPSQANCALVKPPVADQFPIIGQQFVNGGVGNDWSVMRTGTNTLGQTAIQRFHAYRKLGPVLSGASPISMFAYGVDLTCVRSQTQQLSTGTILSTTATTQTFNADVRGGSSGSGLLRLNYLVGVVTHCSVGCPNVGTRIDLAGFANARTTLCNCPACPADVVPTGVVDVDDLIAVILAWGVCPSPVQFCAADANGTGIVDVDDLIAVILAWGACASTPIP